MGKDDRKSLLTSSTKKKSSRSFRGLVTRKSSKKLLKSKAKEEEAVTLTKKEVDVPALASSVTDTKSSSISKIDEAVETVETEVTTTIEPPTFAADDETVYGAEFDEASKAAPTVTSGDTQTKASEAETIVDPIGVVLLMMDPTTRRFELLQLEFDTAKATVSDILRQIPISATEESLKTQSFDCVCGIEGLEYDHDKPLSEYMDGNSVVITVPKTNTKGSEHAAKMARPILRDMKVQEMLKSAGVTLPDLAVPQAIPEVVKEVVPIPPPSTDTAKVTERKITPSSPVAEKEYTPVSPPTTSRTLPSSSPKSHNYTMLLILGVVAAYMIRVLINFQGHITTPLQPGSVLAPGAWRSRCGFAQSSACTSAYIEMGLDGTLQVVEDNGVTFSLSGKVCGEEDEDCVPGAVIEEDGTLKIGGVVAKVGTKSKTPLTPWPFADGVGSAKAKKTWS